VTTVPAAGAVPPPRVVRAYRRAVRRGHGRGVLRTALGATWDVVVGVAVLGALGAQAGRRLVHGVPSHGNLVSAATGGWLLAAAAVALAGAALRGLVAAGPVSAQPAAVSWILAGPVDRAGVLAPRFWLSAAGATALGAAVGALLPVPTDPAGALVLTAAVAGAAVGAAAFASTAAAQQPRATRGSASSAAASQLRVAGRESAAAAQEPRAARGGSAAAAQPRAVRRGSAPSVVGTGLLTAAAVGGLLVAVAGLAGHPPPAVPAGPVLDVLAVVAVVAAAVAGWRARAGLGGLDRGTLASGGALVLGVTTTVAWLDTSLLRGVADDRRWRDRATVRSRRLSGSGPVVLLRADLRRLGRQPDRVVGYAALAVVPYVVAAVADPIWVAVAQVLAGALAVGRLTAGLRTVSDQPGLRRMLRVDDRSLHVLHTALPAVGAVLWMAATAPALVAAGDPALAGTAAAGEPALGAAVAAAVGALAAAVRAATRPPLNYNTVVVPDVGFGAAPVGLIAQVLRGADVALLLAGLILAGAGYPVRLALATVALAWSLRTPSAD
jgi:hypothetical protein